MQVRKAVLRAAGAAMVACAIAPWIGAGSASASVTVFVADKWDGTNSATNTTVARDTCSYSELTLTHSGVGWHFVLPGGGGLTSFSANFATAGTITVGVDDSASGAIVQGGKGAVVYTPTDDVLTSIAALGNHPGEGTADSGDVMQLSHLCSDVTPPSSPPPSTTPPSVSDTPTVGQQSAPETTPVTTPVSTPPTTASTTASQQVSVLPTKHSTTSTPKTSVLGTEAASQLPHTGNSLPVTALVVISLGLLAGGGALVAAPAVARSKKPRRH
jgi:hypothetical protein